jgi:hypothetical protein
MANLWALDLNHNDMPVLAHRIVSELPDGARMTACGRSLTAYTHPRGWWTTESGGLPLAAEHIHCGEPEARPWTTGGD